MKIRKLRLTVIVAGFLGLLNFGLVVAIINQQVGVSRLSSDITQQKQALSKTTKDTAMYKSVTASYENLAGKLGGRYVDVSWSTQMHSVVNQLNGIMQQQGLQVQTLRPEPITSTDGISRLPLRISFQTSLGDLAKMASSIESSLPFMQIERLDINATQDRSGTLQTDMTISSFAVTDKDAQTPSMEKKEVKTTVHQASKDKKKPVQVKKPTGGAR